MTSQISSCTKRTKKKEQKKKERKCGLLVKSISFHCGLQVKELKSKLYVILAANKSKSKE